MGRARLARVLHRHGGDPHAHARQVRSNVIVTARKDVTDKMLLVGMFATEMMLPLLHLATGLFAFANYALADWATWIGAVLHIVNDSRAGPGQ